MNEKRTFIWWAVAAVMAMMAIAFLSSCRSTTKIEKEYIHDTVNTTRIVHDSVDRWRTHYEYLRGDTVYMVDSVYYYKYLTQHDTVIKTNVEYKDKEVEKVVEKKVYLWWPGVVAFIALVAIVLAVAYYINRFLNKMEEAEEEERIE